MKSVGNLVQELANAILDADAPVESLYGIVDVVCVNPSQLDDASGFEGLCWSQLEIDGCSESRRVVLMNARSLWNDQGVRAQAIQTVRTRCHEELALGLVE